MTNTVLRYPGGKSRAVKKMLQYFDNLSILVSPFFGGGAIEFALINKCNTYVIANDKFEPLYNFWKSLKENKEAVIEEVNKIYPINKDKFMECRKKILYDGSASNIERAACFFAVNRTSFSGSTLSGGYSEESAKTRFNTKSIDRLKEINLDNIEFHNMDYEPFLELYGHKGTIYLDPPYYLEKNNKLYGKNGDMHEHFTHDNLCGVIAKYENWIMNYNDSDKIREMYSNYKIDEVDWSYGMNKTKKSSELVIYPSPR